MRTTGGGRSVCETDAGSAPTLAATVTVALAIVDQHEIAAIRPAAHAADQYPRIIHHRDDADASRPGDNADPFVTGAALLAEVSATPRGTARNHRDG